MIDETMTPALRRAVARCEGEGWTVTQFKYREVYQRDAKRGWRVTQADDDRLMSDTELLVFAGIQEDAPVEPPTPVDTAALLREADATAGSGDFSIGGNLWPGLSKVIEECGELAEVAADHALAKSIGRLQRVAGKLIGSEGRVDHWSGDLQQMLVEEIGDLEAALAFFKAANGIDHASVAERRRQKLVKFWEWHRNGIAARG